MKTLAFILVAALGLSGCAQLQSLTPAQQAALFCVIAADGTAIAIASTKGGAQATATTIKGASVVACSAATSIGQVLTPVATTTP